MKMGDLNEEIVDNDIAIIGRVDSASVIESDLKKYEEIEKKTSNVPFDDALAETKFGKLNYLLIFVSGFVIAYALFETLGISFILPVSGCDLNLTSHEKGMLSGIGFIGIITSSHLWGFLADTYGRRKVIRPTLFMTSLFAALSSLSKNFWMFLILRYFAGFFVSGASATIYAYLGEFHTNKGRSRAIMAASFIFGVTFATLPLLAMLVINQDWSFYIPYLDIIYKPWRLFLVVAGFPGIFCGLCLFIIPESPKFVLSQGKEDETIKILKKIYSINVGKCKDTFKVKSVIQDADTSIQPKRNITKSNPFTTILLSMWDQTAPLFMKDYLRKSILVCTIQFTIFITSNGLYLWFPSIINEMVKFMDQNPGNKTTICAVISSNYEKILDEEYEAKCSEKLEFSTYYHTLSLEIMYMVGFAVMGFIINRVGKIPILFVVLFGCGTCGIVAILIDTPLVAVYFYVVSLLCGLGATVINAAVVDLYPTHLRAMAICICLMMGRLGGVVGTNIGGALLDRHCEATFLTSGISLIIVGFLSFLIPSPKHQKIPEESTHRMSIPSLINGNNFVNSICDIGEDLKKV